MSNDERPPLPTPPKSSRPMTLKRLEDLLSLTVSNQKAEGIDMSAEEIEEARKRLKQTYGLQ